MKINPSICTAYFKGKLKKNLREGEEVLREYKKEFPYVKSNTYWRQRIENLRTLNKSAVGDKGQNALIEYGEEVKNLRDYMRIEKPYFSNVNEKIETIGEQVKKRGYGNCGEIAIIISGKLRNRKVQHKNIELLVCEGRSAGNNHIFELLGSDKDMDITQPNTWGNGAVIIDGWRNFVLSVPEAMREYENFYDAKVGKKDKSGFRFQERQIAYRKK